MSNKTGAERIVAERERQIKEEGYTLEHDAISHTSESLTEAARAYILAAQGKLIDAEDAWPWSWDPKSLKYDCPPARLLEKAGALIAAAIDLIDPAVPKEPNKCSSCSDDAFNHGACRDCEESKKW